MARKIKKHNKNKNDGKNKILIGGIAIVALLIISTILIVIESSGGKITIKNNSNLKLEYVKAYYVYEEGIVEDGDVIYVENLEPNNIANDQINEINLTGLQANLEVRFKFEGHDELFVDAGYFNSKFTGNININYNQIDDETIAFKVKASNSLLPSEAIDCNEEYIINLLEGYVD